MHHLGCPKCHQPLSLEGKSYYCESRHTYDVAKQGYINLLLNPDKATNNPGDSRESLEARRLFLDQGYYLPISKKVIELAKPYLTNDIQLLDLGCGEGYYLDQLMQQVDLADANFYGLDISKIAIQMATRRNKVAYWLVGNSKNLPFPDHSLDLIIAMFTVVNVQELQRVLKPGGKIIHVTANNPNHLLEIKELIYDEVFTKEDTFIRLPFNVVTSCDITQKVHIDNHDSCINLLKMTPHYYHIQKHRRAYIDTMENMDITIDVKFTIYEVA